MTPPEIPDATIVSLRDVSKVFRVREKGPDRRRVRRDVRAVDGIDLTIDAGEMVGYIGPNGAGKSTTIKMLTGVLVPSGGLVRVVGLDPARQRVEVARRIGVVFGQRTQLWWDLPLIDSFELLRHVYRTDPGRHADNVATFVDLLDLGPFLGTPVRQLSLGQRMRGELTAALLHDPELVFLDEPTIGLDVVSKHAVRTFLGQLNRDRGTTVLLTTHDLDDIEQLCPRVVIIDHGRVIHDGPLVELRRRFGGERTIVVDLDVAQDPVAVRDVQVTRVEGPRQWLRFVPGARTTADVVADLMAGYSVRDLSIEEDDIDTVVRRIYDGEAPPT